MPTALDLAGMRFGRLIAQTSISGTRKTDRRRRWVCLCDCGSTTVVPVGHLTTGHSRSCGCLRRETIAAGHHRTHSLSHLPEYHIWEGVKKRCYCATHKSFTNYGERGITMSDEWRNDFAAFYRDMGDRPSPAHSIERVNNNDGYHANNCTWATAREQALNRRERSHYQGRPIKRYPRV